MKFLMLAALLSLLTGCKTLPAISAKSIHYQSSYPIGGSTIDAQDVQVTDTQVKVGKYKRTSRWWYVTQDVEITDYSRDRSASEKATIKTP